MEKNYILGLDIGISSVGWGLLELDEGGNPYKIIDVGSRIFAPGEVEKTGDSRAKERREKRGARRVTRRRQFRLDCVRNLLYNYGYLKGEVSSDVVSIKNQELSIAFDNMINAYYQKNTNNPYMLKVKGLDWPLTNEELSIILVHYAKKRGYKSNREEGSDKDSGKVLSAIKENEKILADNHYRTISEMYLNDEKFADKIKNSPGNYKVSVTNDMYLDEINKVLDKQIFYGTITEEFKNEYLKIYNSRRNYSKGPGGNSPYGGNLIEKMTGRCKFDNELRAPKMAPSSEIFITLTKLLNLRYKSSDNKNYIGLTSDEIKEILFLALNKNKITYKDIAKVLNKEEIKFKDLKLSKKNYIKVIKELKEKLNINSDANIQVNSLSEEDRKLYNLVFDRELLITPFAELKGYHKLEESLTKSFGEEYFKSIKDNIDLLDKLSLFATNYKLNEDIANAIKSDSTIPSLLADDNFIKSLPNFKDHLMLSTELIRKLIPLMLKGKRYDEAMEILGYSFSNLYANKEKKDLLVPISVDKNITNQRVMRSLTQTRKVINAIIKKYGLPKTINIETARELSKTRQERNEIEKNNQERQEKNETTKKQLVELGLFTDINKISSTDLLKYNLWKEQNEFCPYSLKKITINDLFADNIVQIDHILPYSRTYNDNYLNKTLVFTKVNQDKKNLTPYEWFGKTDKWTEYESFINSLDISPKKKDNYLLQNLDFDTERAMREQNLNDTKYISKELSSLLKAYLNVENINVYQGAITAKLRARWGFNRLTHSYISKNYLMPKEMKQNIQKDRDNHLHHAIDALIIASITKSLQQKITYYEKFSRYIDGLTKEQLINSNYLNINFADGAYYDDETAEVIDKDIKEYIKEEFQNGKIKFGKHNLSKLDFPLPYDNFVEEAKLRVYEQNIEMLKWNLNSFTTYSPKEIEKVHTLTPSFAKTKLSGALHAETYKGIKKIEDNIYTTSRIPLEKLKKDDLKFLPDKNSGSKDIYTAIMDWFGDDEKGIDALKNHNGKYPINPNDIEKKEIKRIKIYSEYKNTGHMLRNSNVDKGSVYQVKIFKSKDVTDERLYFVFCDLFDIKMMESYLEEKNDGLFNLKLEYGQSKNYKIASYKEITMDYDLYLQLSKNDLIQITAKDGNTATGYVVGGSSGMFEIKSTLGDGYDLIGENKIFNNTRSQYTITVSTIKEIKKLSISILGEISGL